MSANNTTDIEAIRAAEHIYREWDEALGRKDIDAALKLYAPDAVLESPLVRHILGGAEGIVRGRDDLRSYFRLANEQIGALLEALASTARTEPHLIGAARAIPAHLVAARCCYTHLAGRLISRAASRAPFFNFFLKPDA